MARSGNVSGNKRKALFAGLLLLGLLFPLIGDDYTVFNFAYFLSGSFLAMGLSLIWGQGNILSFGQMAFYGIGGYAYGIVGINLVERTGGAGLALLGGLFASVFLAAILGYFMFYGRLSGVFVTILTLVTTLVLETFLGQTAGSQWKIGSAPLGGYNGMTGIPTLRLGLGESAILLKNHYFYYFCLLSAVGVYLALKLLIRSRFGHALRAVGSNRERTEALGYDIRFLQTAAFAIAGGLAGLSGILYVSWGNYITPSTMNILNAAFPVIWVSVGGRKSLGGAVAACVIIQYFTQLLSVSGSEYALIILGLVMVIIVMFFPGGIAPAVINVTGKLTARIIKCKKAAGEGNEG